MPYRHHTAAMTSIGITKFARRRAEPVIGPRFARTRWRFCPAKTKQVSVARGGDGWGAEPDRLLRLQRSNVKRQSGDQEKTDEVHRIGLRRRDRPPHKISHRRCRAGFFFHAEVLLEMVPIWKGKCIRRDALMPPQALSAATRAPAVPRG